MSWSRHGAPRLTRAAPDPPGGCTYGHLRAAGNICEIAVCKRRDILIALFIAVVLSGGTWWLGRVAAESQPLAERDGEGSLLLHKHRPCSMPPCGQAATCFGKDLRDSRHPSALPKVPVQVHN